MKRQTVFPALLAAALLLLCGCTLRSPAETPEQADVPAAAVTAAPEPEAAPEPPPVTEASLEGLGHDEILALAENPDLVRIDTRGCGDYDAMLQLRGMLPDCEIHWTYTIQDNEYDDTTEEIVLPCPDGLLEGLKYLPSVKTVDLREWDTDYGVIDELIEAYPDVDFIFWFRIYNKSICSSTTCFSTLIGWSMTQYTSESLSPLFRYCRHMRALDLGHNRLTDISEIANLKELKVLIIADNPNITDYSPIGELKELEYLEMFVIYRKVDLSFLNELTKMQYLNVSHINVLDSLDFAENMPDLKMLWCVGPTKLTREYKAAFTEVHPGIETHLSCNKQSSVCHNWRENDVNIAIRNAFANWSKVKEFRDLDDIEYLPDAELTVLR